MADQIVDFTCRKCGQTSNLPVSMMASYYVTENEEHLICLACKPIRVQATKLSSKSSNIIISHLNKQVDQWVAEAKDRRKV